MQVTAKRAGWNENLNPVQELDLDPYDHVNNDLQGELEIVDGKLPDGTPVKVYLVGGQEADPHSINRGK